MTSYKIKLKRRASNGLDLNMPVATLRALLEQGTLEKTIREIVEKHPDGGIHDKQHLAAIINWRPAEHTPLTEQAPFIEIANRVAQLSDAKTGTLTLSNWHYRKIKERLLSSAFGFTSGPAFDAFVVDFLAASGASLPAPDEPLEMEFEADE